MMKSVRSGLAVLLALGITAAAAGVGHAQDEPFGPFTPGLATTATVDEILDQPAAYVGEVVTVSGEIEQCGELGPGAFAIEDSDLLFDEEILVLRFQPNQIQRALGADLTRTVPGGLDALGPIANAGLLDECAGFANGGAGAFDGDALGPGLGEEDIVQVTGLVRYLNFAEVEREFGVTLDEDALDEYENDPFIVAFRVDATAVNDAF